MAVNVPEPRPLIRREAVFLLHGLNGHSVLMERIARRLRASGYAVRFWPYWTMSRSIDNHAGRLRHDLDGYVQGNSPAQVHLVGHSMGAIIIRAALSQLIALSSQANLGERIGRIVQLAPPNHGSPVAQVLYGSGMKFWPFYELSSAAGSYIRSLPDPSPNYSFGIIAASRDRIVPLESTHLEREVDHRVLSGGHTTLLFRRQTTVLVDRFLRTGSFAVTSAEAG